MTRVWFALAVVLALFLETARASAHKPSDSYLTLEVTGGSIQVRWDIALRDLDYVVPLDANGDGKITWGELRNRRTNLTDYALARLRLSEGGAPCVATPPDARSFATASHSDGTYAVLRFDARCPKTSGDLAIDYGLFFDVDPQHRGIVRIDSAGNSRTHAMWKGQQEAHFDLAESGRARQFAAILKQGVIHIWTGYDHVLFLLALLLPSVLRREGKEWHPVPRLRPALMDVLRVVTSFTVAHSITLSLAALGVVTLPSRLVESTIAASVVLAALNNLYPVLGQDRWIAAFLLGLMHGFGFSSTLMDLDLPRANLVLTLFGFNAGVELGQLVIVGSFVPLAYAARRSVAYRRVGLMAGSVVILGVAMFWFVERAFAIQL